MRNSTLFFFVFLLVIQQVYGQKKELREERYTAALVEAVAEVKEKPTSKRRLKKLGKIFSEAKPGYEERIATFTANTATFIGDTTVEECEQLLSIYERLDQCRQDLEALGIKKVDLSRKETILIDIPDYTSTIVASQEALASARASAAEMHYQAGLQKMEMGTKDHFKSAAREFQWATMYAPEHAEAQAKYEEAKEQATMRVIILPYLNRSGVSEYGGLGYIIANKTVQLLEAHAGAMEFLDVITEADVRNALNNSGQEYGGEIASANARELGTQMEADQVWTGQITQILMPNTKVTSEDPKTVTKSIILLDNYGIGATILSFGASDVVYQKAQEFGPVSTMLCDLVDAVPEE